MCCGYGEAVRVERLGALRSYDVALTQEPREQLKSSGRRLRLAARATT